MINLKVINRSSWPTGERLMAIDEEAGRFYVWTPRRIKTYTCPTAGVEHKLYWRSHSSNPGPERNHFACEHNSVVT